MSLVFERRQDVACDDRTVLAAEQSIGIGCYAALPTGLARASRSRAARTKLDVPAGAADAVALVRDVVIFATEGLLEGAELAATVHSESR